MIFNLQLMFFCSAQLASKLFQLSFSPTKSFQNRFRHQLSHLLENLGFFAFAKSQFPKVNQHRFLAVEEDLTSLYRQYSRAFFLAHLSCVNKV